MPRTIENAPNPGTGNWGIKIKMCIAIVMPTLAILLCPALHCAARQLKRSYFFRFACRCTDSQRSEAAAAAHALYQSHPRVTRTSISLDQLKKQCREGPIRGSLELPTRAVPCTEGKERRPMTYALLTCRPYSINVRQPRCASVERCPQKIRM